MRILCRLSLVVLVLSYCDLGVNGEESNLEQPGVEDATTNDPCKDNSYCWNGGTCKEGTCTCHPGTSGPFCEIVEGCENEEEQKRRCGNPDNVYCIFNVTSGNPYCRCANVDHLYDPHYKMCKECECGPESVASCSFVKGKKKCTCNEGYGVIKENDGDFFCTNCFCGTHNDGCFFPEKNLKRCFCHPGFSQDWLDGSFGKCKECDCGQHGNCTFDYSRRKCQCEKGFKERDGVCMECDCGDDGECDWHDDDFGEKFCTCKKGYGVNNGKCMSCDCYLGDEPVSCTFPDGIKTCSCPEGYEEINSNCTDINECLNQTACPPYSDCKNTPGSYECTCRSGFHTIVELENSTQIIVDVESDQEDLDPLYKFVGCKDINECVESNVCIHNTTTSCINTIGSYLCLCKDGYQVWSGESSAEMGCMKVVKKDYYGLYTGLAVVLGALIVGVSGYVVYRMLRRL